MTGWNSEAMRTAQRQHRWTQRGLRMKGQHAICQIPECGATFALGDHRHYGAQRGLR